MESFWRRLRYYGFGFGLGLILTFGIFNTRGCSWMPSNRVKDSFEGRIWVMDAVQAQDFFKKNKFTHRSFYQAVQEADVFFSKSKKHGKHKIYVLQIKNAQNKKIDLLAQIVDESLIVDFIPNQSNWKRYKKSKVKPHYGQIIRPANQKSFFYFPENSPLKTHFDSLQIRDVNALNNLMNKSTFDYLKSDLNASPKPIHVFRINSTDKKLKYLAYCILYKDKGKIFSLKQ